MGRRRRPDGHLTPWEQANQDEQPIWPPRSGHRADEPFTGLTPRIVSGNDSQRVVDIEPNESLI
jgi:hypothetical protein